MRDVVVLGFFGFMLFSETGVFETDVGQWIGLPGTAVMIISVACRS
jgi:hypothetical protein